MTVKASGSDKNEELDPTKQNELEGRWAYRMNRDFPREIQMYFTLREQKDQRLR